MQQAKTVFRFDEDETARSLIKLNPGRLFDNPTPVLFDEWQVEPDIWNKVRRQVDDRGKPRTLHPHWISNTDRQGITSLWSWTFFSAPYAADEPF